MAFQILLNVFIAVVWMFLDSSIKPETFIVGYIIGALLIFVMRRYFRARFYLGWVWASIKLIFIFLKELAMSNWNVLRIVLQPKISIQPVIFEFPIELKRDWEITLLANLITLTPGTLVIHVSDDQTKLYIHAIDADNVDDAIASIKQSFEKAIKEVSHSW
ncbi:Na+/H+ antiporter subunit E [Lentibacillus sp. N15]|uniref:Na+/H+ antiporter subunit E n=1 Tax=Lentibacillus songyuanensis TaxID=3136161 RepID=UPI0031BB96C5